MSWATDCAHGFALGWLPSDTASQHNNFSKMETLWLLSQVQPEIQVIVCHMFLLGCSKLLNLILMATCRLNYSQCCSPAIHKTTKLTTSLSCNLEALQVPQPRQEWILPLSLHDVHFVRLINAESLLSLRARDMAIIFTRHTT